MASLAPEARRGLRNDGERYGRVSQAFHWGVAALIIIGFVLGLTLGNWPRNSQTHDALIFVHKSIGLTVLLLAFARIWWLRRSPAPPPAAGLALWERRLAWVTHKALYLLMILYPLSGFVLSQAVGKPVSLWGIGPLPQIVPFDPSLPPAQSPWVQGAGALHKIGLYFALLAVLALHVTGALKHVVMDRDTAMFRRMWGQ